MPTDSDILFYMYLAAWHLGRLRVTQGHYLTVCDLNGAWPSYLPPFPLA